MNSATFRQFEVFVRVVETGGVTAAAKWLNISQAAVSDHIRNLEKQLQCSLFVHRPGASAQITPAGRRAYKHARSLLAGFQDMLKDVNERNAGGLKRLVLLTSRYAAKFWLSEAIQLFMLRYPETVLDLQSHGYASMTERIRTGQADICYFFSFGQTGTWRTEIVTYEPRSLFVAPNHPLAGLAAPDAALISRHPFIVPPPTTYFGECNVLALAAAGIASYPIAFASFDRELRAQLAAEGKGVAYLFDRVIQDRVQDGSLVRVNFEIPLFELHEAIKPAAARQEPIGVFRSLVRESFARHN